MCSTCVTLCNSHICSQSRTFSSSADEMWNRVTAATLPSAAALWGDVCCGSRLWDLEGTSRKSHSGSHCSSKHTAALCVESDVVLTVRGTCFRNPNLTSYGLTEIVCGPGPALRQASCGCHLVLFFSSASKKTRNWEACAVKRFYCTASP